MYRIIILFSLAFIVNACNQTNKSSKENSTESTNVQDFGLSLTKVLDSPKFPDASLMKIEFSDGDSENPSRYLFEVENYELGVQTSDAATRGIANSAKGQHIHFIVNNGPYSAHYMSNIDSELPPGNYTILAFLSRSYHESVKESGAFHIENLVVGEPEEVTEVDLRAPHLFYSRPKGTYVGADTEKVMLDFYLVNCDLSPDGYNIRATINNEKFLIDDWSPYYIKGLPFGENTIKLELLDSSGELVNSPFNPVERVITLSEE